MPERMKRVLIRAALTSGATLAVMAALWMVWTPDGCTRADFFGRCPGARAESVVYAVIAVAVVWLAREAYHVTRDLRARRRR